MWKVWWLSTEQKFVAKQTVQIQRKAGFRPNLKCLTHLTGKKL